MNKSRGFIIGIAFAIALAAPRVSSAQAAQANLPLVYGQKISITKHDGSSIHGTVSAVTPGAVEMQGIRFPVSDIDHIRALDSPWDGAGKGASLGLLLGFLVGSVDSNGMGFNSTSEPSSSSRLIVGIGVGLAGGALLGGVLDALMTRTVYRRTESGPTVAVRPIASSAGKGVGVRVRW